MAVKVRSATLVGVDAVGIEVETQIIKALKGFVIVGLPDGVVKEARYRVRCALQNSGFEFPHHEVVVSLAPASLPKQGAGFDLAVALSILAADGQIDPSVLSDRVVRGELALDGRIKASPGAISAATYAKEVGRSELITSAEDAGAAAEIDGLRVVPVRTLFEAAAYLRGAVDIEPVRAASTASHRRQTRPSFADVIGQHAVKRAMEVAAAGAHNMLMVGPPGAGKSMMARRILSILPQMEKSEALEVARVYAAFELLGQAQGRSGRPSDALSYERPFRAPHHTTSSAGLIGGGSLPVPGEISLAHRGVLFLDEFVEFRRDVLESLREPLETGKVMISRAKMRVKFPSDFMLLAAMNPCPCGKKGVGEGFGGTTTTSVRCECAPAAVQRYASRLSGPILDRIDLQVWVPPVPVAALQGRPPEDPTPDMYSRVAMAREKQRERFGRSGMLNKQMGIVEIKRFCELDQAGVRLLEKAAEKYELSARAYTRVLRTARTIADLDAADKISCGHLAEALSYRMRV